MRVVEYDYIKEYAESVNMSPEQRHNTGLLAQEIFHVLPDAVHSTGDITLENGTKLDHFLVVNKVRVICMFQIMLH